MAPACDRRNLMPGLAKPGADRIRAVDHIAHSAGGATRRAGLEADGAAASGVKRRGGGSRARL